jgi:hypothetical protein
MFISKSSFCFFSLSLGKIRKYYCRVEKASQRVCGGKLEQAFLSVFFWWGWGGWVRCLLFCNTFEGNLGELVFQQNFTSFMKSKKLKEEKEREKKYIRSLKMCLLFLKKIFLHEISEFFFWNFLQFFNLKNQILTYSKDCIYVEIAQIRQNLII